MFKPKRVQSATVNAYMNNKLMITDSNYDYTKPTKLRKQFTAIDSVVKLCINGTFAHSPTSLNDSDDYAPLIDNVTLN